MIRPYQTGDFQDVIKLFLLNTPEYFAAEERTDLEAYLEKDAQHFFVFEKGKNVVGAGGYNILEEECRISWYFIHPDFHGHGIGKALVEHSLKEIKREEPLKRVMVRTSQHAWRFFEKMGFELQKKEKDYWAPGFDLYQMELKNQA